MKRRDFLKGALSLSLASLLPNIDANAATRRKHKDKLSEAKVVILSDLHIETKGPQIKHLEQTVDEILNMRPRPEHVISLGDMAYLTGKREEYQTVRQILEPLWKAGIKVTLGMGNHDRREEFAEVFPEFAAASLLPHRYVYHVTTTEVDFIILDTLNQGDDRTKWITPGTINDEQREWLKSELSAATKPTFVCAHHPLFELNGVVKLLLESQWCCGYLYGHDHRWRHEWHIENWKSKHLLHTLCMPSTGLWGDIGYTTIHPCPDRIVAKLHQHDFFFPGEIAADEYRPDAWEYIVAEHQNLTCTFGIPNPQKRSLSKFTKMK